jgi:hypothetical protein
VENALAELIEELPLGPDWDRPTLWHETARIAGLIVPLVGLHARNQSGSEVTAGASGPGPETLRRCYFELLERSAIVEALARQADDQIRVRADVGASRGHRPVYEIFGTEQATEERRPSLSNGVAAHERWGAACAAARLEAIERDRVLRSWYGLSPPPVRICARPASFEALGDLYEAGVYRFGDARDSEQEAVVVGVFLLPKSASAPFVCAFAADRSFAAAVERAVGESLQRLGFLWQEPIPVEAPPLSPTPEYHLEFFLYPPHQAFVQRWLKAGADRLPDLRDPDPGSDEVLYADLTPPHLRGRMFVARALGTGWLPLVFGRGHPDVPSIPDERLVHPIP